MKFFKRSIVLAFGLFLMAGAAFAQTQQMQQQSKADSVTDQELEKFAAVTKAVQNIQRSSQQEVQSMLSDKEMTMQRFQRIMMSKQNPNDSLETTAQEEKTIKEMQPKLMKMQQESRKEMMSKMQEHGLSPQRFQAIMRAIQTNPSTMKRFQKIAKDSASN